MKKNVIAYIVGFLLLLGSAVYAGYWFAQPTISDLAERNRALAAADSTKAVQIDEWRTAYERAVFDFTKASEVRDFVEDSLQDRVGYLTDALEARESEIETLVTAVSVLRDTLEDVLEPTEVDGVITAPVEARNDYRDGEITADGDVEINTNSDPMTGRLSLVFGVTTNPVVAISRDTTGLATCHVTYGDMPIVSDSLVCVNNLTPELPARQSFWDVMPAFTLGGLGVVLVGVGALLLVF